MTFLPGRFDLQRFWLSTLTIGLLVGGLFVVTGQPHAQADVIGTICIEARRLGTFMLAFFGFLSIGLAIAVAQKAKMDTGGWDDAPWRR